LNIPSPHDPTKLPSRSKIVTGCSPRLKTYTRSRRSTSTPETSLNDHPSGSRGQSWMNAKTYSPSPTVTTRAAAFLPPVLDL
jgi:hypothetical protein